MLPSKAGAIPSPPPTVCVFCSATSGASPAHLAAARSLAQVMHDRSMRLIYGGATTGMMGELAKTLVGLSGPESVHGIVPLQVLDRGRPSNAADSHGLNNKGGFRIRLGLGWGWGLEKKATSPSLPSSSTLIVPDTSMLQNVDTFGRVIIVNDVPARKKRMMEEVVAGGLGSGFIGLSGGFGTMDELMELVTWNQLGVHRMGVCLFNVEGYWDGLLSWLDHAIEVRFVREDTRDIFVARDTAVECIEWLQGYAVDVRRLHVN